MTHDEKNLRRKIKILEEKLAVAVQERDDLTRDLENLCLSEGFNTSFSSSSVLSERIYSTEKELTRCKAELQQILADRDSLKEDLNVIKEAKRQGDLTLKQQHEKITTLDRELLFYQQQAAKVMADRDKLNWESEELRGQNLQLDMKLREFSSRAETEGAQRRQLENQIAFFQKRVTELENKAAEAAIVPSLKQELKNAAIEISRLQKCERILQDEVTTLQSKLAEAEERKKTAEVNASEKCAQLAAESAARSTEEARLRSEIVALEIECENMRVRVTAAEQLAKERERQLNAAEHADQKSKQQQESQRRQLEEQHIVELRALKTQQKEQVAQLQQQLRVIETALSDAQGQVEEVLEQKVAALMRQSTAETAKAKADACIEHLMTDLAKLRDRLDQVTTEKVEALLQIAELQGMLQTVGAGGRTENVSSEGDKSSSTKVPPSGKAASASNRSWFGSPLRG